MDGGAGGGADGGADGSAGGASMDPVGIAEGGGLEASDAATEARVAVMGSSMVAAMIVLSATRFAASALAVAAAASASAVLK